MVDLSHIAFELVVLILFLWILRHAWQRGLVGVLLSGVVFGLLLEWATIKQLDAYSYGQFLAMLGPVPVVIGVAWGCIVYAAIHLARASSLPRWAWPVLGGIYGLSIDLAMDTIAIRLGMWDWGDGLQHQFFGVPYANFWAWFWVVSSFTLGYQLVEGRSWRLARWLAPLSALLLGLGGVLGTNALIVFVVPRDIRPLVIGLLLGTMLALLVWLRPRIVAQLPPFVYVLPLTFHIFFLLAGLITGVILDPPALLAISLALLLLTLLAHYRYRPWRRAIVVPGS